MLNEAHIPVEFLIALEDADLETLEDGWLARIEERRRTLDQEIEAFAATAHGVASGEDGDPDHARSLLEILDEQLQGEGMWQARLELLRHAGQLLLGDKDAVHREIAATLDKLYGDHEIYEGMADDIGIGRATHDLEKTWEKVERLHAMMRYDIGTIVAMDGRGVGTVVEANFQLGKLRVDFARHAALNVGFRAAPKMLEPLAPDHILRRKVEDPDSLKKLAKDDPPALLRIVLESRGTDMAAGDVRKDLTGVVTKSKWTSFWNAARKHPQVVVHGKGRQSYSWAASSDHAVETVWDAFEDAPPRKKLDLLRREGEREEELAVRMAESLTELGREVADDEPGLAFEIWAALDRAGHPPGDDSPFAPEALFDGAAREVAMVLDGIEDRSFRERAYQKVHQSRDDWREVFAERLPKEEDPKTLDFMYRELREDDDADGMPKELGRFLDGVLAQPHRSPSAFVWMVERAVDDLDLVLRNPLRMLQQILTAIGRDEFKEYRVRLRKLLEKGGTASKIFPELSSEQAETATEAIHRAGYIEDYEREELQRALELSHPELKGEAAKADVLWATEASIEAKTKQLEDITRRELPANRKAIEEARAMGDLRENFEYKSARQRHGFLTALASEISAELSKAKPIDLDMIDASQVRVGTRLTLEDGDGGERTLSILGPWESSPEDGVISYESELAEKLLGKGEGEAVETAPGKTETITSIQAAEL